MCPRPRNLQALTFALCIAAWSTSAPATYVIAWGWNGYGQVGDGSFTNRLTPTQTFGLELATHISGGGEHSLALMLDGSVWAWGRNLEGQLGTPGGVNMAAPIYVGSYPGALAVEAGQFHSMVLLADGSVLAWGSNAYGQLGNGSTANSAIPAPVQGLTGAASVSGGQYHTLAAMSDGTVRAWGRNDTGSLGNGTYTNSSIPVTVTGLSNVAAVSAGDHFSLALLADGTVRGWGFNSVGQLGLAGGGQYVVTPQNVGLSGVRSISAGGAHGLAALADGTVKSWGYNGDGQLGDGTTSFGRASPMAVAGLSNIVQVVGTAASSFALGSDGRLWAWGRGIAGTLGVGDESGRLTPTLVAAPEGVMFASISGDSSGDHVEAILVPFQSSAGACCRGATCTVVTPPECTGQGNAFAGAGLACNAAGNQRTPCCKADFDHNGVLAVSDILDYVGAWFAADPRTDADGDRMITVSDVFSFVQYWFAGCS